MLSDIITEYMRSISRTGCWEKQKSIPLMLNSVASPPLALPPLTIGQHSLALFQCCALPCMDPSHPYCWLVCEPWPWRNSSTGQGPLPTKLPTAMKSLPGRALWWSVCCFVSDDLILKYSVCCLFLWFRSLWKSGRTCFKIRIVLYLGQFRSEK